MVAVNGENKNRAVKITAACHRQSTPAHQVHPWFELGAAVCSGSYGQVTNNEWDTSDE